MKRPGFGCRGCSPLGGNINEPCASLRADPTIRRQKDLDSPKAGPCTDGNPSVPVRIEASVAAYGELAV